ncbi:MAG: VWA domain-containing protein [Polyangiaceae bacterium]|nr:VWA domain-containing protein [Polyangiaceae bacterium]
MRAHPCHSLLIRLTAALSFVAALLISGSAFAEGTLRTVLVIDASSSMLSTDPKELRKVAAELFVDLARYGDEIAVTGFDGGPRESTGGFIAIKSPEDRQKLKAAIRAVGKNGAWTDFTAGLGEAARLLSGAKKEAGDQSFVVFLTDGRCDPDPKGALGEAARAAKTGSEALCKQRVLESSIPALKDSRVYAVGLSRSAPKEFLEEAARLSGGVGIATEKAEELPRIFAEVYARLLGSTLVEGPSSELVSIAVDEGALSLDVVVVGPPTLRAQLIRPDGREVSTANAKPELEYYSDTPQYRFYKVAMPPVGNFQLKLSGGAKAGRYAALQNLDLRLSLHEMPDVLEIGSKVTFKARLATPGGRVPAPAFLDRHVVAFAAAFKERCSDPWLQRATRGVPRGADNMWGFTITMQKATRLCILAEMAPGPGGVLSRKTAMMEARLIPPIHLKSTPLNFGKVKQDAKAKASLDMSASEVGTDLTLSAALVGRSDLTLKPDTVKLEQKGERVFEFSIHVDRNATPGPATLTVTLKPTEPTGFENRAIDVDLTVDVVPLTFWERYGFWIKVGVGIFLFFFILIGIAGPARFRRNMMLHYEDRRDPDLPREATYPLGVKATPGFYRGAKLFVAATGPVKKGGVVELTPAPGGGVFARILGSQKALELPRPDAMGMAGEPRDVPIVKGRFRMSAGTRYEVAGSGLVMRVELKKK